MYKETGRDGLSADVIPLLYEHHEGINHYAGIYMSVTVWHPRHFADMGIFRILFVLITA